MFHSSDLLVIFVPLSGYEDYISFLCKHASCTDCFFAVGDTKRFSHIFRIQSGKHIVDDVLWLFKAGIIRCYNYPVAGFRCFFRHDRAFSLITVAAGTYYGDHFTFAFEYSVNGIQYVNQCIRRMCIVNDCCHSFRRTDGIETSGYRMECTKCYEYLFLFLPNNTAAPNTASRLEALNLPIN